MSAARVARFRSRVLHHCELECMATQDAIDELAIEFSHCRAHMLAVLAEPRFTDADLCDLIMVAWARAPLKRATGLDRDEWLQLFSQEDPS